MRHARLGVNLFATLTFAVAAMASAQSTPSRGASPLDTAARSVRDSTIVALRAQNELIREYDAKLLQTVYWSLSLTAGLALALSVFGWYTNYRVYERDKAALKQDLASAQRDALAEALAALTERFTQLSERLTKTSSSTHEKAVAAGVAAAKQVSATLDAVKAELRDDILGIQYEMTEQSANRWLDKGVHTNDIRDSLAMIRLAKELGHEWRVSRGLDRLNHAFRRGARPDAELGKEVMGVLERLPPAYAPEVEALKSALRDSRTATDK